MGAHVYARQLGPVLQRLGRRDEVVRCLITAMREQSVGSGTTVLKVSVANDTSSIHPSQDMPFLWWRSLVLRLSTPHLSHTSNDGACPLFTVHATQPSEEHHCFPPYPQAGIRSTPIFVSTLGEIYSELTWYPCDCFCPML